MPRQEKRSTWNGVLSGQEQELTELLATLETLYHELDDVDQDLLSCTIRPVVVRYPEVIVRDYETVEEALGDADRMWKRSKRLVADAVERIRHSSSMGVQKLKSLSDNIKDVIKQVDINVNITRQIAETIEPIIDKGACDSKEDEDEKRAYESDTEEPDDEDDVDNDESEEERKQKQAFLLFKNAINKGTASAEKLYNQLSKIGEEHLQCVTHDGQTLEDKLQDLEQQFETLLETAYNIQTQGWDIQAEIRRNSRNWEQKWKSKSTPLLEKVQREVKAFETEAHRALRSCDLD